MSLPTTVPPSSDPGDALSEFTPGISRLAWSLTVYGDLLHDAGAGLRRINTPEGWSGAAADQFQGVYLGLPEQWLQAGDSFHAAADALRRYAETVTWAQEQADAARRQWSDAQQASQAAAEQYRQAAAAGPVGPFVDPGDAGRAAARATLDRLGVQVAAAGDDAAAVVERARDQAPRKPALRGVAEGLVGVAQAAGGEAIWPIKVAQAQVGTPPAAVSGARLVGVTRTAVRTVRAAADAATGVPTLGTAWDPVRSGRPDPADVHVSDADRARVLGGARSHWTGPSTRPWTDDRIVDVLEDVARRPDRPPELTGGGTYRVTGTRDGMRVTVLVERDGRITDGSATR